MICGTGCDIVEVGRFKKLCTDRKFIERYFNKKEICFLEEMFSDGNDINECDDLKLQSAAEKLAARFAVKECFGKALGCGIKDFCLNEVYTVNNEEGKPLVTVCGKALKKLEQTYGCGCKIHVSISHEKKNALAFLIIEKE